MSNFKLFKTEINTKAAKYLYEVKDENGNVIESRKSNREYVACTIDGNYFFGRVDLIGKGDHGRALRIANGGKYNPMTGKIDPGFCAPDMNRVNELNTIAYL